MQTFKTSDNKPIISVTIYCIIDIGIVCPPLNDNITIPYFIKYNKKILITGGNYEVYIVSTLLKKDLLLMSSLTKS